MAAPLKTKNITKGKIADKNPTRIYRYRDKLKRFWRLNPKINEIRSKKENVVANDCLTRKDRPKNRPARISKLFFWLLINFARKTTAARRKASAK
jgi:hypothetical protein